MIKTEFDESLKAQGAIYSSADDSPTVVTSFGDPVSELQAACETVAVFPLTEFGRIRLTGKDRVKFLHNFCTNDVKGMASGEVVEAFLTDVRARVLGHGYIASFEDRLELWMLPGDAEVTAQHLQKYVIVEDVTVQVLQPETLLALAGPGASELVSRLLPIPSAATNVAVETDGFVAVVASWNQQPMIFVSIGDNDRVLQAWQSLISNGGHPAGQTAFQAIRIMERFPVVGCDLTDANMAPEADRNDSSICYTKGCYLGQEPIARLDAMGHVNRQLYAGVVEFIDADDVGPGEAESDSVDSGKKLPVVTSVALVSESDVRGLAVLPVKTVSAGHSIEARTPDGRTVRFTVTQSE